MMNHIAEKTLNQAQARYAEINVGDLVFATPDGASFVTAFVYAIEDTMIIFQRGETRFDCPRDLAELTTLLIARYEDTERASLINEILEMAVA